MQTTVKLELLHLLATESITQLIQVILESYLHILQSFSYLQKKNLYRPEPLNEKA